MRRGGDSRGSPELEPARTSRAPGWFQPAALARTHPRSSAACTAGWPRRSSSRTRPTQRSCRAGSCPARQLRADPPQGRPAPAYAGFPPIRAGCPGPSLLPERGRHLQPDPPRRRPRLAARTRRGIWPAKQGGAQVGGRSSGHIQPLPGWDVRCVPLAGIRPICARIAVRGIARLSFSRGCSLLVARCRAMQGHVLGVRVGFAVASSRPVDAILVVQRPDQRRGDGEHGERTHRPQGRSQHCAGAGLLGAGRRLLFCSAQIWPFRKISVELSTKRKIAVQFCKISDESTAIWRFFRLRFGVRFV
eukprot:scaffold20513_cov130-Isochrysis_galbana.AAC.1